MYPTDADDELLYDSGILGQEIADMSDEELLQYLEERYRFVDLKKEFNSLQEALDLIEHISSQIKSSKSKLKQSFLGLRQKLNELCTLRIDQDLPQLPHSKRSKEEQIEMAIVLLNRFGLWWPRNILLNLRVLLEVTPELKEKLERRISDSF